jgi:hypothetical protein
MDKKHLTTAANHTQPAQAGVRHTHLEFEGKTIERLTEPGLCVDTSSCLKHQDPS